MPVLWAFLPPPTFPACGPGPDSWSVPLPRMRSFLSRPLTQHARCPAELLGPAGRSAPPCPCLQAPHVAHRTPRRPRPPPRPASKPPPDAFAIAGQASRSVRSSRGGEPRAAPGASGLLLTFLASQTPQGRGLPRGPGGGRFSCLQVDRSHPGLAGPKAGVRGADQVGESKVD